MAAPPKLSYYVVLRRRVDRRSSPHFQSHQSVMPLIEVLPNTTNTSAPGWAYVPDTGYDPSKAAIQPSGARQRATRGIALGVDGQEMSVKQNNAIIKRLAELDKDNHRDVHIPIPARQRDGAGRSKFSVNPNPTIFVADCFTSLTRQSYHRSSKNLTISKDICESSGRRRGTNSLARSKLHVATVANTTSVVQERCETVRTARGKTSKVNELRDVFITTYSKSLGGCGHISNFSARCGNFGYTICVIDRGG